MNFANIGWTGILLIVVVLLIFWGPSKLPEIGRSFGKSIKEFKNATNGIMEEPKDSPAAIVQSSVSNEKSVEETGK
ncbi:twin-arginine translocase TatA/TatE family subunit [Alicyclobacillaceae bacterium I2511]|jgi:sec-independent protein translocase protein TatA|nr:twin-arginine translocase TatA/TatE family subunit [Alicyclobacillaceae bacterium I2511]